MSFRRGKEDVYLYVVEHAHVSHVAAVDFAFGGCVCGLEGCISSLISLPLPYPGQP